MMLVALDDRLWLVDLEFSRFLARRGSSLDLAEWVRRHGVLLAVDFFDLDGVL